MSTETKADLKQDLASLRIDRRPAARGMPRWPLLLLLPALVLVGALYLLRARKALEAVEVDAVVATAASAVESGAPAPLLSASGYVVPRRKAVVSAKIQGRLSELRVEEGSRVKRGEIIARLESADYRAQVLRADAAVHRAEADLAENQRQLRLSQNLAKESVVSQDQVDAAVSRVRMAEAALDQAKADLGVNQASYENTLIRAPFTGVVLKKMAEVGESVAPIPPGVNISTSSGAIVALADLDTLEVEADVAEANVARLRPDQPADASVEALPDRRFKAVLRQVIPTADRTRATVQVKVTILDKDPDLKPEMSARITFVEAEAPRATPAAVAAPAISVPQEAVVTREGKSIVFEIKDGRALARPVVTGGVLQGRVVVREGLAGSERLVARPPENLKDGDSVRVRG